jgi:desulfoferrodoxin-like iron-binding protein
LAEKLRIYKCEVCGSLVEVWHQGRGSLSCCGLPLKFLAAAEQEAPLLELVENWVDGQSYWYFPLAESASSIFPGLDAVGQAGYCEVG